MLSQCILMIKLSQRRKSVPFRNPPVACFIILYKVEIVGIFVSLYVCLAIAREEINRFTNLACSFPETRKRTQEGQNSGESVLSSILDEGCSCSSETKHNRRTTQKTKLFVSKRILQKQRPQPRKTVLSSISGACGFCTSENKHEKRRAPGPEPSVSARKLQQQSSQNRKNVLGSSPDEDGFRSSETKHDRRTVPKQNLFVSATLQELRSGTRKLPWVRVPAKILGSRISSYGIQRYVSNDQAYEKQSSNKDKH
jgi:hypothetical protein